MSQYQNWLSSGFSCQNLSWMFSNWIGPQELGEDSTNKWTFSRDGSLIILAEELVQEPCIISAFATGSREKGWKVGCLWKIEYRLGLPDSLVTNSKYLLLSKITDSTQYHPLIPNITKFHIVRLDNGKGGTRSLEPFKGESRCYELTESHLIAFGKHGPAGRDQSLMALTELETRTMNDFTVFQRDSWLDVTKARKISGTLIEKHWLDFLLENKTWVLAEESRKPKWNLKSFGNQKTDTNVFLLNSIQVFRGGTLAVLLNDKDVILINNGKSHLLASPQSPSNRVSEIRHKGPNSIETFLAWVLA